MSSAAENFTIRPAENRDVDQIKGVVFGVLREYGLQPDPAGTDADLNDVEASYAGRGGSFQVVEDGVGRLVGTVGLMPLDGRRAELRKMYLHASVRGRGLGRRLLEAMLAEASRLGYEEICLQTNSVLKEAVSLYRKYGFEPSQRAPSSARCDQMFVRKLC